MIDKLPSGREISIDSIVIGDRTRKDFGDIDSLAESIPAVGLMQPIVINENNELIDGQRRINTYIRLGRSEIPFYQVKLKEIVFGDAYFYQLLYCILNNLNADPKIIEDTFS